MELDPIAQSSSQFAMTIVIPRRIHMYTLLVIFQMQCVKSRTCASALANNTRFNGSSGNLKNSCFIVEKNNIFLINSK